MTFFLTVTNIVPLRGWRCWGIRCGRCWRRWSRRWRRAPASAPPTSKAKAGRGKSVVGGGAAAAEVTSPSSACRVPEPTGCVGDDKPPALLTHAPLLCCFDARRRRRLVFLLRTCGRQFAPPLAFSSPAAAAGVTKVGAWVGAHDINSA